jgi:predicted aldo/keto reductase-like oxidoreductase
MGISRREFLESAAIGAVAAPLVYSATGMPMRTLGRTGAQVSILAFGGGSRFVSYGEAKGIEVLNKALDQGITYIDTAESYGNGASQTTIGKTLKGRGGKKGLWLASKIGAPRTYDNFMRLLDASLKRLQVDQVDLLHIHALMGQDDLDAISAKGGAYEAAMKAKEQKMTRFIGITCHAFPDVLKTALERHDFDCTQMALNAAMRGQEKATATFEETALPVALKKKMGVTAMKIFAQDKLVGQAPPEKLIQYSMSLPVAATVIGMPKVEHIEQNIAVAKAFKPMPLDEMRRMSGELAPKNRIALERYFRDHVDA